MPRVLLVLLAVGLRTLAASGASPRLAPNYTAASIVNAADNQSDLLAPNTIATLYGVNLAYSTAGLTTGDVQGGVLPITLGKSETMVYVGGLNATLYYVSPTQINFLVPPNLLPLSVSIYVTLDGLHGPMIPVTLAPTAPALFQGDQQTAIATHADGSLLTTDSPAHPGDIVVLYATGLGATVPPTPYGQLPTAAAPLAAGANLQILLDGAPADASAIQYAGIAPYNAGLYQINLALPAATGTNPEIRLKMGNVSSIAGIHLPVSQ